MEVLEYIKLRKEYFASKTTKSGWTRAESGPCCDACIFREENLDGRAEALKRLTACRNPFQLEEICQCHIPTREAVRAGIVEAFDQIIRKLEEPAH